MIKYALEEGLLCIIHASPMQSDDRSFNPAGMNFSLMYKYRSMVTTECSNILMLNYVI